MIHLTDSHTWVTGTTPLSRVEAGQRLVLAAPTAAATAMPDPELQPKMLAELSRATRFALDDAGNKGAVAELKGGRLGAAAQNNLRVLNELEDRLDRAIPAYETACHADPYVPIYHFNLGWPCARLATSSAPRTSPYNPRLSWLHQ